MSRIVFVLMILIGSLPTFAQPAGFERFITRDGDRLMDGDKPFRFMGANMPGLVVPYDFTMRLPHRMRLATPWEQEDAFKTLAQMNLGAVRTWNLPIRKPDETAQPWHYVLGPGKFNDEAFKTLDHLLALANKHKVRVILDLTAGSGDYLGGIGTYASHRGKKRAEFFTDPQVKEDYKATVQYVFNRKNTVTGTVYKDDKAILAWQFGNEIHEAPEAWISEMAKYFKSLDPQHLVMDTRHRNTANKGVIDENVDIYTRHYYTNYSADHMDWVKVVKADLAQFAGKRPFIVGEFGPYYATPEEGQKVIPMYKRFLDYCVSSNVSGAMLWSMYFRHEDGGFYWHQIFTYPSVWSYHWPGFPSGDAHSERNVMGWLRDAAFAIQGKPVPPIPAPEAPQLLPIGEVPLISWRGSVGATGYDIERAASKDGPWMVIAKNASDADCAYRPLYSDTSATPGQTYFYRVIARNQAGQSGPSNVMGPVAVKSLCFVDELQDLSRPKAKSERLMLNNTYNGIYAEYLFRARGEKDEWLEYQVPGTIESIMLNTFFVGEPGIKVQVSADGQNYTDVIPESKVTKLPPPPGGPGAKQRRNMVEYRADVKGGRFIRIGWPTAMELDRVEIRYK